MGPRAGVIGDVHHLLEGMFLLLMGSRLSSWFV
jgi:hypothetical protein